MNYRFESQNSVVKIIKKEKKGLYTGFSRVEDYFLYKGVNRTKQIFDHNKYARIYIRADNKLIEIKREYQKALEFYADATSLLGAVFFLLNAFFEYYDTFKVEHSILQKLFFFEEFENHKKILYNPIAYKETENEECINNIDNNNKIITYKQASVIKKSQNQTVQGGDNNDDGHDSKLKISRATWSNKLIKNKFSFNKCQMIIFGFFLCFSNYWKREKKYKLMELLFNTLDKKVDIFRYIRNMICLEIIYKLLIDDNYKEFINYLSRSLLYLENNGEENRIDNKIENTIDNKIENTIDNKKENTIENFYKYSDEMNSDFLIKKIEDLNIKMNKTEIEKKLISLIN
jgi:hypothetical protein